MKVCPTCNSEYTDDTLNFCLMDGAPLIEGSTLPTVAIPTDNLTTGFHRGGSTQPSPPRKKSKILWIIAAVFGMMILVAVSVYFLAALMSRGQAVRANRERSNSSAVGNSAATRRPARSATPEPTPETEPPASLDDPDADDPTPIQWPTAAAIFDTTPGRKYRFECPEDGTAGTVWGSDVYSAPSSICTAAVHAGAITLEDGGDVEIEFRSGQPAYGSTTQNGITTDNFGEYSSSFVVVLVGKKE
ncbi:MAG: LCCL domain-containing protein [Pyrinomonadaceae bacterium]